MKKVMFLVGLGVLFLGLGNAVHGADIEAVLDSSDGSSGFVVQDSGTNELFRARSDGNVGIGHAYPRGKLHLLSNSTTDSYVFVASHTTGGYGLVVSTNGNVGIGTDSPSQKLHVYGGYLQVERTDGNYVRLYHDGTWGRLVYTGGAGIRISELQLRGSTLMSSDSANGIGIHNTDYINFFTAGPGNERMRITSTGNVGIGTASPDGKLDVEDGGIYVSTITAPGTPNAGKGVLYAKDDKKIYFKNEDATEYDLTAGGGQWTDEGTYIYANNYSSMVVTDSGYVGIGRQDPRGYLEMYNNANSYIILDPEGYGATGYVLDFVNTGLYEGKMRLKTYGNSHYDQVTFQQNLMVASGGTSNILVLENLGNNVGTYNFLNCKDSNGDTQFVVREGGNVGIGTTSPDGKLDVEGGGIYVSTITAPGTPNAGKGVLYAKDDKKIYFKNEDATEYDLTAGGGQWTDEGTYIYANNYSSMVVTDSGYVGIGTTAPGTKLEVYDGNIVLNDPNRNSIMGVKEAGSFTISKGIQHRAVDNAIVSAFSSTGNKTTTLQAWVGDGKARVELIGSNTWRIQTGDTAGANPTSLDFIDGSDVRMTINSSGNVGIGHAFPRGKLHLLSDSTTDPYVFVTSHTTGGYGLVVSTNGNVGIGTTGPTSTLHVVSNGSMAIPQGASPTVDAAGELAVDTTDDQLIYYGGAKRVLRYEDSKSFILESPADADIMLLMKVRDNITITSISGIIDPEDSGESVVIALYESDGFGDFTNLTTNGLDGATTITVDNDGATDDGSLSNPTVDAGDWIGVDIGIVTGTVSELSVTWTYTVDAQ